MSISLVQSVLGGNNSGTITAIPQSVACTANFGVTTTSGNLIMAVIYTKITVASGSFGSISFSVQTPGVTWTAGTQLFFQASNVQLLAQVYYLVNAAPVSSGTATTFKATQTSGVSDSIAAVVEGTLYEFSGTANSTVEGNTSKTNQTTGVPSTNNLNNAHSDLIVVVAVGNSGANSAGAGYNLGQNTSAVQYGMFQYQLNAPTGVNATGFSGVSQANWSAGALAFKPLVPVSFPAVNFGSITGA